MITQTMYAIRNNKTGFYMPARDSSHKGATHAPFIDPNEGVPRLFKQHHHARHSLDWWVRGKYTTWVYEDGEFYARTSPMPDREKPDYEIVQITLTIP